MSRKASSAQLSPAREHSLSSAGGGRRRTTAGGGGWRLAEADGTGGGREAEADGGGQMACCVTRVPGGVGVRGGVCTCYTGLTSRLRLLGSRAGSARSLIWSSQNCCSARLVSFT